MKLEIWKEQPDEEKTCFLHLYKNLDAGITLEIVDGSGHSMHTPNILTIRTDGQIRMHTNVNNKLGFVLDARGKVVIV